VLLAVLLVSAMLRLAPLWAGYRRVWHDQDAWLHLRTVERLRALGRGALARAFYDRELNQPDPRRHPWPPLAPVAAAGGSYLMGVEWSVRVVPIAAWTLAGWWLYRLARTWSLAQPDAVLAVALAGFSIEMVRQQGMHFTPNAVSALLAIGLVRSAFLLAHSAESRARRILATALWTALTTVGYGPNLFHIGTIVLVALMLDRPQRRVGAALPAVAAMVLGFGAALPYVATAAFRPAGVLDYFTPIGGQPRLVQLAEAIKYPILIGPLTVLLALAAAPRLAAACRAREPWALWLVTWIVAIAPQTLVWVFIVPGPPFRLLILLIPPLALAAAVGFREITSRFRLSENRRAWAGAGVSALTAAVTVAFLALVEIPRRRISDGEIQMYQRAASLPSGSILYLRPNSIFVYYCGNRLREFSVRAIPAPEEATPEGAYWLISDREWTRPSGRRWTYEKVVRAGRNVFEQDGSRIVRL
jgi:hypothetical protein